MMRRKLGWVYPEWSLSSAASSVSIMSGSWPAFSTTTQLPLLRASCTVACIDRLVPSPAQRTRIPFPGVLRRLPGAGAAVGGAAGVAGVRARLPRLGWPVAASRAILGIRRSGNILKL